MPLQSCEGDGWRWGRAGKCYHGPDAKRRAINQGLAAGSGTLKEAGIIHRFGAARLTRLRRRVGLGS